MGFGGLLGCGFALVECGFALVVRGRLRWFWVSWVVSLVVSLGGRCLLFLVWLVGLVWFGVLCKFFGCLLIV